MKLTDLINERNRLDAAFPKQQGGYCDINIFTLEEELEQYGISWLEKILKDPTNNQPFVEEVENRCKGFMRQQPAQAGQIDLTKLEYAASRLRLAAIEAALKKTVEGKLTLPDDGDPKPEQVIKPEPKKNPFALPNKFTGNKQPTEASAVK